MPEWSEKFMSSKKKLEELLGAPHRAKTGRKPPHNPQQQSDEHTKLAPPTVERPGPKLEEPEDLHIVCAMPGFRSKEQKEWVRSFKKSMEEHFGGRHGAKTNKIVSQARLGSFQKISMSLWKLLQMSWNATVGPCASGMYAVGSKRAKEDV